MQVARVDPNVQPVSAAGSKIERRADGSATLTNGTTYYYELGGEDTEYQSVHIKWDATIVLTSIEVEDSNFPDVTGVDATAGNWVKANPATGIWDVFAVGAGATVTASTTAVTGGAAGGVVYNRRHGNTRRSRLKVVVGATGGVLRVAVHGKS